MLLTVDSKELFNQRVIERLDVLLGSLSPGSSNVAAMTMPLDTNTVANQPYRTEEMPENTSTRCQVLRSFPNMKGQRGLVIQKNPTECDRCKQHMPTTEKKRAGCSTIRLLFGLRLNSMRTII